MISHEDIKTQRVDFLRLCDELGAENYGRY